MWDWGSQRWFYTAIAAALIFLIYLLSLAWLSWGNGV